MDKRIALIGSWRDQEWIHETMNKLGLMLSYIADNNPNKQGVLKLGIKTCSVESLKTIDNLVILVSGMYYAEISQQLKGLGLEEEKNYFILALDKKTPEEFLKKELKTQYKYENDVRKGFDICMDIRAKYGEKPIWVMYQISLGDLYLFSLLLPGVMKKKSVNECDIVLVVARKATAHLAEVIGYKNVELVTLEDMTLSLMPLLKLMGEDLNLHNAVCHGTDELFVRLINYTGVNFLDSFKEGVFYLTDDVKPIYPIISGRETVVQKLFEDNDLQPGKTILIAPYATHFTPFITNLQWKNLVRGLKEKGYTVCTNCAPGEEPIDGTKGIFIDINDCNFFLEKAGGFIGVRSGLCDLICMSNCKKIIIYDTNGNATIDYFGFSIMNVGENISEIVNDTIHTDEMISNIIAMF